MIDNFIMDKKRKQRELESTQKRKKPKIEHLVDDNIESAKEYKGPYVVVKQLPQPAKRKVKIDENHYTTDVFDQARYFHEHICNSVE